MDATSRKTFARDGAILIPGAACDILDRLAALPAFAADMPPGRRLFDDALLHSCLSSGTVANLAKSFLGNGARPVRAIAFDKRIGHNWVLDWHQDRTIAVVRRLDVPGFGPWGEKAGQPHVAPPFDVLEGMITMRIHLDAVEADNAPLLIAPGSHRLGRLGEAEIPAVVERLGQRACLALPGDVWVYATPILHASRVTRSPRQRRVLQVDFAAIDLPGGLEWAGV